MSAKPSLHAATSMATSAALRELAADWTRTSGVDIQLEAVGGVTIVQRVRAGEMFDVVFLADDLLATLEREGLIVAGSRVGIADSAIAVAVKAGARRAAHPAPCRPTKGRDAARRISPRRRWRCRRCPRDCRAR